jgi:hypothetical protein
MAETMVVNVITSSEIYITLNPYDTISTSYIQWNDEKKLVDFLSPEQILKRKALHCVQTSHLISDGDVPSISAMAYLNLTNGEIISLLERVKRIVDGSEAGLQRDFENSFLSDQRTKRIFTPLGLIKIFSRDRICFYNGKNWRKIKV